MRLEKDARNQKSKVSRTVQANAVKHERCKMQLNKEKLKQTGALFTVHFLRVILGLYTAAVIVLGAADYFLPDSITVSGNAVSVSAVETKSVKDEYISAKLFGVVPVKNVKVDRVPEVKLIPGGNVFGVKFFTKGVIVINLSDIDTKLGKISPAEKAGMKVGDVIESVNGESVNTVERLSEIFEESKGREMLICYSREGKQYECKMSACLSLSDKKYKTGIWVRDSTAGIGTMTFYNPQNGIFAGLGHGICDVDTGEIMPLLRGTVVDVELSDIIKGRRGTPGELKGSFDIKKKGALTQNTRYGVFGIMDFFPDVEQRTPVDVAFSDKIHQGKASIYSQISPGEGVKEYQVNIISIDKKSTNGKNFVIEITDKELLSKTGGIVQGM